LFIRITLGIEKATGVSFSLAFAENIGILLMKRVYQGEKPMSLSLQAPPESAFHLFIPPPQARRFRPWPALVAMGVAWRLRQRTRQHLATLDDRALADVGLTRAQQRGECAKPFWQL
jgi:uncharacterized protein YjiS (DUF1127 family)